MIIIIISRAPGGPRPTLPPPEKPALRTPPFSAFLSLYSLFSILYSLSLSLFYISLSISIISLYLYLLFSLSLSLSLLSLSISISLSLLSLSISISITSIGQDGRRPGRGLAGQTRLRDHLGGAGLRGPAAK